MLKKTDVSASFFVVMAVLFFMIGGLLTTVVPPMVDKSWARPFENNDPAKGPTGKLRQYTEQELQGRAIYIREGCWYCHTQQTRTLLADTKRSGWRGVDSPVSTPDEFVYDSPHLFGTKRTGPDLSRVGGKYDEQWHRTHFRNPRDLVPGSIMPPFPWIASDETEFKAIVAYMQSLGRAKNWRPDNDYEK
ncbi:MAG: cbb3-type cytochrome c oxidase subunit II [Bryobacteraceae bacterium]|nr:cbb3-type cytochrome c oxidase subunit II [Bryobacteraceae bacterium]